MYMYMYAEICKDSGHSNHCFRGNCFPFRSTELKVIGWRQRNQQAATNLKFIVKLLSQHVSGIIMPIYRRTRVCTAACGVLHWLCWLWLCGVEARAPHNHNQYSRCRTPYAIVYSLVLLKMGIMMPETCWGSSLIINIRLVASCWLLSLQPMFTMHCHKSLKFESNRFL